MRRAQAALGETTISADGRLITYASDRGGRGNLDIYVQQTDGSNIARFTDDPADDYDPAFSPDGAQIAFRSERNGGGIYEVSSLRGSAHLVVPGGRHPRFSPDGRYLLYWQAAGGFDSKWGDWGASLFTAEVAGGSPVPVSRPCTFVNGAAVWSPDSKRVLFAGICQGRPGIWLASPDGKVLESSALTRLGGINNCYRWIRALLPFLTNGWKSLPVCLRLYLLVKIFLTKQAFRLRRTATS